jgi:NAD(P)-dependent dehydrogenase (short-subunit alcohol dehydrogenase family)
MDFGLRGKTVLITGAAGGIGRATAEVMAAEGARIIGVDLDDTWVKEVPSLQVSGAAEHLAIAADLSTRTGVAEAMREALHQARTVDVFVSNAGILSLAGTLEDLEDADWDRTMAVNFHAFHRALPLLLPGMRRRGQGAVVVNASDLALQPEGPPDYGISKVALLWLLKPLADAEGRHGIRVNAVAPAPVRSPMWSQVKQDLAARSGPAADDAERAELAKRHLPLGRVLEPREVADTITYLASDRASGITGTVVPLGGTTRSLTGA